MLGFAVQKLGQILSTRFDILPYDYVKGLEKLQDSVPPFDGELAYQIVCDDIGPAAFQCALPFGHCTVRAPTNWY